MSDQIKQTAKDEKVEVRIQENAPSGGLKVKTSLRAGTTKTTWPVDGGITADDDWETPNA